MPDKPRLLLVDDDTVALQVISKALAPYARLRFARSGAEALKAITTSDKERGNHYFRYTDQKWGKAQNYDICINSALMGIEKTAEMLTAMAKIEVRA